MKIGRRSFLIKLSLGITDSKKLILPGPTHGGQITFFGKEFFKPASRRNLKGWYENEATKMYVSKGIGTTLLPIRFCARAGASIFYV